MPFASRFPLPHFIKICRFIRPSYSVRRFLAGSVFDCEILFAVMDNSSSIACTPENEVLNFKQRGGESLKDAWYRICNAHNRSIRKQSTIVLLRCFYVGITTWYRFVHDMIPSGNFLMSPPFDALNAM